MKKNLLLISLLMVLLPLVTSNYYQVGNINFNEGCENLNCSNTCYLTIKYPNQTDVFYNEEVTLRSGFVNYSIGNLSEGTHNYYFNCSDTFYKGSFEVTGNGKPAPSGVVIVGFGFLLLLILASSLTILIKTIGHIISRNFDIMDLGVIWGLYFALLGLSRLAYIYLGNMEVINWLDLFVTLYGFPMVVVPIIALLLSIFDTRKKKREEANKW